MIWFKTEGKSKLIIKRTLLCGTLVLLLVILAITQSAIPALVMCYSDDGHRAIEIAHDDSCRQVGQDSRGQDAPANAESGSAKVLTPRRHSGTCLDIPLGNDVIAQRHFSLRKSFTNLIRLTLVMPTFSIALSAASTMQSLSPFLRSSPPPDLSALFALRTVVLLN